jgi:membrane protein
MPVNSIPSQGPIPTLINIGVLLFGASVIFTQLQKSLNKIWEVQAKPENGIMQFLRKRLLSFSMVLVIAFLLLVSLVVSTLLVILGNYLRGLIPGFTYLWQILNALVSFGIVTLLFAMMFKILPGCQDCLEGCLDGCSHHGSAYSISANLFWDSIWVILLLPLPMVQQALW